MRNPLHEQVPVEEACRRGDEPQHRDGEAASAPVTPTPGLLGDHGEFLTRRKQQRFGAFLTLVRVERWDD